MRKLLTVMFCLLAFQVSAQGIKFYQGTWNQLLSDAAKTHKPFFVDIYATWCGPCKAMAAKTFKDATVAEYVDQHFLAYQIDAEKGEGISLAEKFRINAYPTVIFFNQKGEEVGREVGFENAETFLQSMKKYVQKINK